MSPWRKVHHDACAEIRQGVGGTERQDVGAVERLSGDSSANE
jgi:hypothetical protein